ncbi:MAG: hypothetical protein K2F79_07280, partial [Muribaculaceae bacterium]|nr:hypothetical protein [Muribaculaceae bacterium]
WWTPSTMPLAPKKQLLKPPQPNNQSQFSHNAAAFVAAAFFLLSLQYGARIRVNLLCETCEFNILR